MKTVKITAEAKDPKVGMTINELYEFVNEAMAAGVPAETVVAIGTGWRGQLQKITIDGPVGSNSRTIEIDFTRPDGSHDG